jgi:hypothetical protein
VEPSLPEFYNDNNWGADPPLADFEYDGFTDVLTATAFHLAPADPAYEMKIGVGDVADQKYDCALFVREDSFWIEPVVASKASGDWEESDTWTVNPNWSYPTSTPSATLAAVIGPHAVTVTADAEASSVLIDDGAGGASGLLTVAAGKELWVGTDVWVTNGTLDVEGILFATSHPSLPYGAGSELWIHPGGSVTVAAGGGLYLFDWTTGTCTRDNRLLLAGGNLEVHGSLAAGTLLIQSQETDNKAVLDAAQGGGIYIYQHI